MSHPPVTRFAPSPTGFLHLGNARTALFNALMSRGDNGRFLLRLEDTDQERSEDRYREALVEDLRWLGLDWQAGYGVGGEAGPWRQAERGEIYAQYFQQLEDQGLSYPCFCSRETLERTRRAQRAAGQPPRYPGTCAGIDPEQARRRLEAGEPATWRFRVPRGERVEFEDFVRGRQVFETDEIGDFVIRRTDGTPAFFFSNALDDALMGVSHVLRGEDHLANTPRQLLLLAALGLAAPAYGHLPLIADQDGGPLSKRAGSLSLRQLREAGYLPGALCNYMARLGHHYEDEERYREFEELARDFRRDAIGRSPARFDPDQLRYWQKQAVARLGGEAVREWLAPAIRRHVPPGKEAAFAELIRPNVVFPEDARDWADRLFGRQPAMDEAARSVVEEAGPGFYQAALDALEATGTDYAAWTNRIRRETGAKGRGLFMPLRVALTGRRDGPGLDGVLELLGTAESCRRLERCASLA